MRRHQHLPERYRLWWRSDAALPSPGPQAGVIVRFPSASMSDGRVAEIMPSELNTADSSAIPEISHEELRRRLHDSSLTIVDVLPEASYIEAHIPGALSLPLEQLASRARELLPDPAAEIAVYCGKFT
jgi:Rhodanese-like domain